MLKSKSKTLVIILLAIVFMLGGIQVYASTTLDTNLYNLIRLIFDNSIEAFDQKIYSETQQLVEQKKDQFNSYIDSSTNKVIRNIEDHIDLEVDRADAELDSYIEELMKQMDSVMVDEEKRLKELMTNHVNESINVMKNQLYSYLYLALDEHYLENNTSTP